MFAQTGSCLQSTSGRDIPFPTQALVSSEILPSCSQVIIPSYQFQCHGNITAWETYVSPNGETHRNGFYTIVFQIWRPSPTAAEDGCYSTIASDSFDNIVLLQNPQGLVSRTLTPADYIPVQPGDVVGYFLVDRDTNDDREGIQLEARTPGEGEEVWYQVFDDIRRTGRPSCEYTVGAGRNIPLLTSSAPLFNVVVGKSQATTTVDRTALPHRKKDRVCYP